MKPKKGAFLLLIFFVISCTANVPDTPDEEQIKKEIQGRYDDFVGHMNRLEIQALTDFYSNDDRFYWVEDGKIQYATKEALTASLKGLVDMLSSSKMDLFSTRIEVTNESSALLYAEYEQRLTMSSGMGFDINGAMTILMQKEDGIWRFLIGHSSTKKERG